ncbi:E3 ubiquitin-protein ligase RNF26 [Gouania willdenowi]|uniref:E3 ubiquitin-protein ligase RNF26 n=1 Tax=Gouania willdenowi TaxID=441366 RepID=UPI001056CAC7|nr:E3 ubiquitin-protein ligase RNF26 [Gouania willdenowi]
MGLVNFVISTVGRCLDAVGLLLDLNFLVVHTVVRTLLAIVAFINSLPTLLICSLLEVGDFLVFCVVSTIEASTNLAHGTVSTLASLMESLKMVGYLSMHVLLWGKDHLCRGLLSVMEGCGIAVSLVVYLTNTVVNYTLIAMQNVYLAVVSVWQTVSSPLQKILELVLTSFTFLYSSLVGTSAALWCPFKLLLDFLVSLVHIFISIFILNFYGLLLTVTIALTTTAYLNPGLTRQVVLQLVGYVPSFPAVLRRRGSSLQHFCFALWRCQRAVHRSMQRLMRILHRAYLLERELWHHLSHHGSQLRSAIRSQLLRGNNDDHRAEGDGDAADERRDPPDGRAGDGAHQEGMNLASASTSTDHQPVKKNKKPSSDEETSAVPQENLMTLLKEQEERKKCVICQDCTKTVVLLPCRHLCVCRDCTNILLRQPVYQQNCPLCRHMILNTMDVYL